MAARAHENITAWLCCCLIAAQRVDPGSVLRDHQSLRDVLQWKMVTPAVHDAPSSTGHVYRSVAAVRWALTIKDCGSVDGALRDHLQVCDMGLMMDAFLQI